MSNVFNVIQLAIMYGPTLTSIFEEVTSNDSLLTKIEKEAPAIGPLIAQLGAEFFPTAAPTLQKVGAVVAAFSPDYTKWLQGALNVLLTPSPNLTVDGMYGPKTKAAIQQLQAKLGLTPDGIAGKITQAAIEKALGALK